jgi:adsorption protein B
MEPLDFRDLDHDIIHQVPGKVALHYAVLPLRKENGGLVFGSESAIDPVSLAALSRKVHCQVSYVIVPRGQVVVGLRYWYGHQQVQEHQQLLERAVSAGFLSKADAKKIWGEYVAGQIFFAEVLVSEHKLDDAVLRAVLLRYEHSDMLFGEFLVQEGVVSQEAVDNALDRQRKLQPSLNSLLHKAGIGSLQLSRLAGEGL